ncbi:MAG: DNA polymerase III subunit gamma/tau [Candidatus Saccharibacteria bacterium]|nr:DNA polymerase III subunit gamma/tau [Candidatus Saccharibacteria bacterium]
MAKALYRKYRPKSLSEVVGQNQVTDVLSNSLKSGKISHAYLFIGPRGTGKTSVARIFAHEVNNFSYEIEDDYVDIVEIDGASNRGIDNIRELREKALIAPTSGKYKIYIIDEVHMLTKEAFNALLKIIEEPPEHIIFIMATTDAYKVPVTITSRAQTYTFKLADQTVMFAFLKSVAEKEKIQIEDEALSIVTKRGGGSFRDSLSLLDQISSLSDSLITKELVISAMGLPEDEKIRSLLEVYVSGSLPEITAVLKELLLSGAKPETIAEEIISFIIENPKPEYLGLLSKLPEVKAPFPEAKLLVALTSNINAVGTMTKSLITQETRTQNVARPLKTKEPVIKADKPVIEAKEPATEAKATVIKEASRAQQPIDFNWDEFVKKVKDASEAVYSQLLKTSHEFIDGTLEIYPEKKIVKTILSRDSSKKILVDLAMVKVKINEVGENRPKDETLARISDIMGGEVKNDGGENPF